MSWHLPHRLTNIHHAVSVALLCSVSSIAWLPVAQAATMGKTTITSAQHEPLTASITVTDIDAKDFAASIASPVIYQQMGLTPTASMAVRFVPISATAGQLLIQTSQPVTMPFADVVLAINDNGQRNVIPKTLLMPLGNNNVPIKQSKRVVSGAPKPNLPVVSNSNAKPLTVRRGAPPPLIMVPDTQTPASMQTLPKTVLRKTPNVNAPAVTSPAETTPLSVSQTSRVSQISSLKIRETTGLSADDLNNKGLSNVNSTTNNTNTKQTSKTDPVNTSDPKSVLALENSAASNTSLAAKDNTQKNKALNNSMPVKNTAFSPIETAVNTNKQADILNIQVTRQIQLKTDLKNSPNRPTPFTNDIKATSTSSNAPLPSATVSSNTGTDIAATDSMSDSKSTAMTSYTVQRNDNLWLISQQIAQQNNVDVSTVMKQIKSQNPDAFIAKDADLLKANAELSLPSYDIVPSQESLQTAIAAQRQHYIQVSRAKKKSVERKKTTAADSTSDKELTASTDMSSKTKTTSKQSNKPSEVAPKTLPKARFSVVAPGRDGSADGTQTKAGAATGNGLSTDILATLKSARQRTAEQAKRVAATNSILGSYAKKLQLQNQKLAELEARLKKLRNQ
ncbi:MULTISPECIES: type IV pilus assembly protein FimV [unclassified Psychrobacter]|uniref:type IV pilus assembly protein FimV n=1 Tax=unclassified Psychrobacter TaxID=196806 RepID=UPI003F44A11C